MKNTAAKSTKPSPARLSTESVLSSPGVRRRHHGVASDQGSAPAASTTGTNHHGCSRSNEPLVTRSSDSSRKA